MIKLQISLSENTKTSNLFFHVFAPQRVGFEKIFDVGFFYYMF